MLLFFISAAAQIKQDDPLVLNYGCLNNDPFLLDYGFVIPSNPHDCIELKHDSALLDSASTVAGVSAPNFSSPSSWLQQFLHRLNLDGEKSDLNIKEAVEKHDLDILKSSSSEAPRGISTEVAALRTLIALCSIAPENFPGKIKEDETILKKNISTTTELAVGHRIQKKFVIVDAMRDLTRRVKHPSSSAWMIHVAC